MDRPVLFLDDGGVMNDNARRGVQWQQLLGEFLPPLLGGAPEAWAAANRAVAERLWQDQGMALWEASGGSYAEFNRRYARAWLGGMCEIVGVVPPEQGAIPDLTRRAERYITERVRSAIPGAITAIRALRQSGYTLHTASGETSWQLDGYLTGMGVRECFGRLYGPDLLDWFKAGPEYYVRLLADAGIAPTDALIVDDRPGPVAWAVEAGARAILVGPLGRAPVPGMLTIPRLADLPRALQQLG